MVEFTRYVLAVFTHTRIFSSTRRTDTGIVVSFSTFDILMIAALSVCIDA